MFKIRKEKLKKKGFIKREGLLFIVVMISNSVSCVLK